MISPYTSSVEIWISLGLILFFCKQLFDLILQNYNNSLGLVNYENNSNSKVINEILDKNLKLVDLKNKKIIEQCDNLILVIEKGKIKNSEIKTLNKYISIYKEKFIGWIYIDTID